jgi:hypothetical protein
VTDADIPGEADVGVLHDADTGPFTCTVGDTTAAPSEEFVDNGCTIPMISFHNGVLPTGAEPSSGGLTGGGLAKELIPFSGDGFGFVRFGDVAFGAGMASEGGAGCAALCRLV